jgi:hypothetical protein
MALLTPERGQRKISSFGSKQNAKKYYNFFLKFLQNSYCNNPAWNKVKILKIIVKTLNKTRQPMYVCMYNVTYRRVLATIVCSGKAISITSSECVSVALVVQHAMRLRRIITYDLPRSRLFFHIIS